VRRILHRQRAALSSAERLAIEEHASRCERCDADIETIEGIRRLLDSPPVRPLGPRGHGRAIERSFALAAARREKHHPIGRPLRPLVVSVGLATTATAAILLYQAQRDRQSSSPSIVARSSAAAQGPQISAEAPAADHFVTGDISAAGAALSPGAPVPQDTRLDVRALSTLRLGAATLRLPSGTSIAWNSSRSSLELFDGTVDVEVDPVARPCLSSANRAVCSRGDRHRVHRDRDRSRGPAG
jgi:hypothetical protein